MSAAATITLPTPMPTGDVREATLVEALAALDADDVLADDALLAALDTIAVSPICYVKISVQASYLFGMVA